MKRCSKCKVTRTIAEFAIDRSRADGHSYVCTGCRGARGAPTRLQRRIKRVAGFHWCRTCEAFLPSGEVHGGLCRRHNLLDARERYRTDAAYRFRRMSHSSRRFRGVNAVPPDGGGAILELFNGCCAYCPNIATTWDHVHAVAIGGETEPTNIVPACKSCNSSKRDRDVWEWLDATGRTPSVVMIERVHEGGCGALS